MSRYLICSIEVYNKGVEDGVKLTELVNDHSPVYSPDGKEVLVKGIGDMSDEDVDAYILNNWVYVEGETIIATPVIPSDTIEDTSNEPVHEGQPSYTDKV